MSLDHKDLCRMHDRGYERGQHIRDQASNDLVFAWITQWDDALLSTTELQYKGEFNIIRKATRQISAEIHSNPVQVDFEPRGRADEEDAELADGIYRAGCRENTSIESFDNGADEAIHCGVGAWELTNEYETNEIGERNQVIKRWPLHEAVNRVIWDPNAVLMDKSDADYCSVLVPYSAEGYRKLHEELTGEELPESYCELWFKTPNQDRPAFPWITTGNRVWVARFYHREKITITLHLWRNADGEEAAFTDEEMQQPETEDFLVNGDFEPVEEREYERYQVTRYVASGKGIIDETVVPGTEIPVVPVYGERAMVEGEEVYEGVVRLAKDPQRLRNFQMSYLQEIVGRSPRQKPIYVPEQLQGWQHMFEETGADNNFPYLLQNRFDSEGRELPMGPVGESPEQKVPVALAQALEMTREAVEDVANPGLPQNIADPDVSGKAVLAIQERLDMQSFVYQKNFKHAKRRDGAIFASMLGDVYDSPRKVTLYLPDETRKEVDLMATEWDTETWQERRINDLRGKTFNVFANIGKSYNTQKQQTIERLEAIISGLAQDDPLREVLLLKYITLMDGTDTKDVRNYARMQLITKGVIEPETDEEKQKLAAIQKAQGENKDPMTIAAEAESTKAQADMMDADTRRFDARTKRLKALADAKAAGLQGDLTLAQTEGVHLDNAGKYGHLRLASSR